MNIGWGCLISFYALRFYFDISEIWVDRMNIGWGCLISFYALRFNFDISEKNGWIK